MRAGRQGWPGYKTKHAMDSLCGKRGGLANYSFLTPSVEIKKANLYGVLTGAILCRFSNAAGRRGAVEWKNARLHGRFRY
jgi:hypothetical protein